MIFLITADLLGLAVIGGAAGVNAAVLAGYQACAMLARAGFHIAAVADRVPTPAAWALIISGAFLFVFPARRMRLITDADLMVLQALCARLKARSGAVRIQLARETAPARRVPQASSDRGGK